MSEVIDLIPVGDSALPVIQVEKLPVDMLSRQKVISDMSLLLEIISDTKGSCTFALNGKWGSGKSFVLNILQRKLMEYQDGNKYLVFHYNCWQYDYYEEPLIAIVAAMMDSIEEQERLFSGYYRKAASNGLAAAKPIVKKIASEISKNKLGVDLVEVVDDAKASVSESKSDAKKKHDYDQYYGFKKVIKSAQEGLKKIAEHQTIVVIVDELDRCLPSYAIKVMERLHHLFYGLSNTAVLMAVDKAQLENTVQQIFGAETATDTYLKKFINFELELDVGEIKGGFSEKYADYIAMFEDYSYDKFFELDMFYAALFDGIDIRTQERLIERVKTVHKMIYADDPQRADVMCFEMIWAVLVEHYGLRDENPIVWVNNQFEVREDKCPRFVGYMNDSVAWGDIYDIFKYYYRGDGKTTKTTCYAKIENISSMIIWYLNQIFKNDMGNIDLHLNVPYEVDYKQKIFGLRAFGKLLSMLK